MERRQFLWGALVALFVRPETAHASEYIPLQSRHFTHEHLLRGGTFYEDAVLSIEDPIGVNYEHDPVLGFHCQMTTSHSRVHARPLQLRHVDGRWIDVDNIRAGDFCAAMRVRFAMHDGTRLPPKARVRVWVQMYASYR